jgi:23S rRNA (adenine2503-C2)-methyltransferase
MSDVRESSADIMDLTFAGLEAQMAVWHEPRFRARQIWHWLYIHLAGDFEQMSNLPLALRERLARVYRPSPLAVVHEQVSPSRLTRKVLFRLPDGEMIESVLMRYGQRRSVCVSSQVGCPVACGFCATGQSGFVRNLSPAEIVAQPLYFARQLQEKGQAVSNIVLMGMGEPLLNYDAVWQAVETWNDADGFNMGARRITISTAGYVPGIRRLAGESLQVRLAVSLHGADDALRDQLVPLNRRYPLADLMAACRDYTNQTGRRITIEYTLIEGVNDAVRQAHQLAILLRGLLCHVNLIPLNPTPGSAYRPSPLERVRAFQRTLREYEIPTTLRIRRGIDIEAGCGQLRQRHQDAQAGNA